MNGKTEVLQAAEKCEDEKCRYLVDKDWDELILPRRKLPKRTISTEYHSIENYLLNYDAWIGVLRQKFPRDDASKILSPITYLAIVSEIEAALRPLFCCFVQMMRDGTSEANCSLSFEHFATKSKEKTPCLITIINYCNDNLRGRAPNNDICQYFRTNKISEQGHGKILLNFIWEAIRTTTKAGKESIDSLMVKLAQNLKSANIIDLLENICFAL